MSRDQCGTGRVYHRLESDTQTQQDAVKQVASGEVWGKPPWNSFIPKVKAYPGSLPPNMRGIEFVTDIPPDKGGKFNRPEWSGPRSGVRVEDGFAKIKAAITKNTQV